jgi:hypothetical protein
MVGIAFVVIEGGIKLQSKNDLENPSKTDRGISIPKKGGGTSESGKKSTIACTAV